MNTSVPSGPCIVTERRNRSDRRRNEGLRGERSGYQRRVSPDRRLNNISVEWIPFSHIHVHPVARFVFGRR
jgi:hypothetical protein